MGVNRGNKERRNFLQHGVQFQFADKIFLCSKMMGPENINNQTEVGEKRKNCLFHKLSLAILLNMCRFLTPPQTS